MRGVELASGYDGPLRGAPEPVLVFGVVRVTGSEATLISRSVVRLLPSGEYPEHLEIDGVDVGARIPRAPEMRVLVIAAALEEDDGRGVQRVYADLGSIAQLCAWPTDERDPEPLPLVEWARSASTPPATTRVHLVDAAGDLRDRELGDEWIGAALFSVGERDGRRTERRMRFASEDGRNDWTVILEVRLA